MAKTTTMEGFQPLEKSRAEWKKLLPADRYAILFEGSTDYYKKNPIRYKFYRYNCGRDQRLKELWGKGG